MGETDTPVIFKNRYQLGEFNYLHNEPRNVSNQCFEYGNMLFLIFHYIVLVGARFSTSVQTGPGAHTASYTIGTRSFPGGESGRGVALTTPHLATSLRKE
jgi:hypothetical protein